MAQLVMIPPSRQVIMCSNPGSNPECFVMENIPVLSGRPIITTSMIKNTTRVDS